MTVAQEIAGERRALYLLLARVFAREPDGPFLESLKSSGLRAEMERRGFGWEGDAETLAVEYTRLFIGPGPHASLYGSVNSERPGDEGRLWGDSTVKVKQTIEAAGLSFVPGYGGIPDHLAVELEFLARVAEAQDRADAEEDAATAAALGAFRRGFIHDHVLNWLPAFAEKVGELNPHPFYSGFVRFCREWIESDGR